MAEGQAFHLALTDTTHAFQGLQTHTQTNSLHEQRYKGTINKQSHAFTHMHDVLIIHPPSSSSLLETNWKYLLHSSGPQKQWFHFKISKLN